MLKEMTEVEVRDSAIRGLIVSKGCQEKAFFSFLFFSPMELSKLNLSKPQYFWYNVLLTREASILSAVFGKNQIQQKHNRNTSYPLSSMAVEGS